MIYIVVKSVNFFYKYKLTIFRSGININSKNKTLRRSIAYLFLELIAQLFVHETETKFIKEYYKEPTKS